MSTYALLMAKAMRKYFRENWWRWKREYLAQWIFPRLQYIWRGYNLAQGNYSGLNI